MNFGAARLMPSLRASRRRLGCKTNELGICYLNDGSKINLKNLPYPRGSAWTIHHLATKTMDLCRWKTNWLLLRVLVCRPPRMIRAWTPMNPPAVPQSKAAVFEMGRLVSHIFGPSKIWDKGHGMPMLMWVERCSLLNENWYISWYLFCFLADDRHRPASERKQSLCNAYA